MEDAQVTRFTQLWAGSQPSVFAFICGSVPEFADAEDILQRTASAAVAKFEEYDGSRLFVAWSIGIARFEILRFCRERATDRHRFVAESLEQIAAAFVEIAPELDERRRAMGECLRILKGRSRRVLDYRYEDGLKTAAIAEAMGLTAGNVSVILNRTYQKLRECIEGKLQAEGAK